MEEVFYILIPIAVAVLMFMMDMRENRRHERQRECDVERIRQLELTYMRVEGVAEKQATWTEKMLEQIIYRIEALEGSDSGLPKEHGDSMSKELERLRATSDGLAMMYHELKGRVIGLEGTEGDE